MRLITPLKAIRQQCLWCVCGSKKEVRLCENEECSLYPFRFGKNPYQSRTLSKEEHAILQERAQKMRESIRKKQGE